MKGEPSYWIETATWDCQSCGTELQVVAEVDDHINQFGLGLMAFIGKPMLRVSAECQQVDHWRSGCTGLLRRLRASVGSHRGAGITFPKWRIDREPGRY